MHTVQDPEYGKVFDAAMTSFFRHRNHIVWVLQALKAFGEPTSTIMDSIKSLCDVGGGQGHLLCSILSTYPNIERGAVMDLPQVLTDLHVPKSAEALGVADRAVNVVGDVFEKVESIRPPSRRHYTVMKHILHDWNDEECVKIFTNQLFGGRPRRRPSLHCRTDRIGSRHATLFEAL